MKYLHVTERDGRYLSELREAAVPEPRADEVLVRVAASGLNRADLSQIAGRYPPPPGEPEILGLEVAGTLPGSDERVCALLAGGGHAEYVAAPRGQVFPAPPALDLVAAAGIPEAFLTAFVNLVVEGGLAAGDGLLIHAGASGVDLALLGPSVAPAIEQRWGPDSVAVVLDPVGATTLPEDLAVLAPGGRIISIATLGGATAPLDLSLLMRKRARLIGSTLRARSRTEKAALVAQFRRDILPAFDRGALRVTLDAVVPPAQAAAAFQRMHDNANTGKLVIQWR